MRFCLSRLDFVMEFIDALSARQQDTLSSSVCLYTIQTSSEFHILFDVCKDFLCLDHLVHLKLCPIITGELFGYLLTFFSYFSIYTVLSVCLPLVFYSYFPYYIYTFYLERTYKASAASIDTQSSSTDTVHLII